MVEVHYEASPAYRAAARDFCKEIEALGDSSELRIAAMRVEEAVLWVDRHLAARNTGRNLPPNDWRHIVDIFDRIAAAIQAKNSGDNPTYDAHLAALDQQISDLKGVESGDAANIASLNSGLQKVADAVNPPPQPTPQPEPASLTVSPASLSGTAGVAITGSLSVSGGTAPYSYSSSLTDLTVNASGNVSGTPAAAETGTITVSDSSSPALTATVDVTIAAAQQPTA